MNIIILITMKNIRAKIGNYVIYNGRDQSHFCILGYKSYFCFHVLKKCIEITCI